MSQLGSFSREYGRYVLGFVLSLLLSGVAYIVVSQRLLGGTALVVAVLLLAMLQAVAQLVLFLYLGREPRPRWKMAVFGFMIMVLGILVLGSLWIMQNLNYNMMPQDMNTSIVQDEGIKQK